MRHRCPIRVKLETLVCRRRIIFRHTMPRRLVWPCKKSLMRQRRSTAVNPKESVPVRVGRTVHVTRAAGPTVWLDFDQLCAQPLGASDYLALCQRFEVLLVDHVPQLDANTFNEARRFVTLIDAVNETQFHLVLATAVPVDRLFAHFDAHVETND